MNKIFAILALIFLSTPAFADNSARIKELTDQLNKTISTYQQYTQTAAQLKDQAIALSAIISELKSQDEKNKPAKPSITPNLVNKLNQVYSQKTEPIKTEIKK